MVQYIKDFSIIGPLQEALVRKKKCRYLHEAFASYTALSSSFLYIFLLLLECTNATVGLKYNHFVLNKQEQ